MDRGKTGEERPKGEVHVHGIDATCFVPASRIEDLPVIIGSCDDPAKPGDLIFGDVTVLESENKNKDPFPSIRPFKISTAITGDHYCNQNKYEIETIGVKVTTSHFSHTRAGSGQVQKS